MTDPRALLTRILPALSCQLEVIERWAALPERAAAEDGVTEPAPAHEDAASEGSAPRGTETAEADAGAARATSGHRLRTDRFAEDVATLPLGGGPVQRARASLRNERGGAWKDGSARPEARGPAIAEGADPAPRTGELSPVPVFTARLAARLPATPARTAGAPEPLRATLSDRSRPHAARGAPRGREESVPAEPVPAEPMPAGHAGGAAAEPIDSWSRSPASEPPGAALGVASSHPAAAFAWRSEPIQAPSMIALARSREAAFFDSRASQSVGSPRTFAATAPHEGRSLAAPASAEPAAGLASTSAPARLHEGGSFLASASPGPIAAPAPSPFPAEPLDLDEHLADLLERAALEGGVDLA